VRLGIASEIIFYFKICFIKYLIELEDILAVNSEVSQSNQSSTEIPKRPRRKIFDDFKPGSSNSTNPPISNQKEKVNEVLKGGVEVKPPGKG